MSTNVQNPLRIVLRTLMSMYMLQGLRKLQYMYHRCWGAVSACAHGDMDKHTYAGEI